MATTETSPVLARLVLAKRLHQLRRAADYTNAEDVAAALGWHKSKVTRWEDPTGSGLTLPKPAEIDRALTLYGASDTQRADVAELVKQARRVGWPRAYRDVIPKRYETYIGLEEAAATLRIYESHAVPELLTTPDYGRAAIAGRYWTATPAVVDRLLEVRQRRQERLHDTDPLELWAVVEEAALRRPVADADVMRDQLAHLWDLSRRSNIHLQILPASTGAHPAVAPFVMCDFSGATDEAAFVPTPSGGELVDRHDDIIIYRQVFQALIPRALSVHNSRALVEKMLSDL